MPQFQDRSAHPRQQDSDHAAADLLPGKATYSQPLQLRADASTSEESSAEVHRAAQFGLSGTAQPLPYLDIIQPLFGRHDVTGLKAYIGGPAAEASKKIHATAYATKNAVAFAEFPDLFTATHEAAHAVQQKFGVQLAGGVGKRGDTYEQHADAVANLVVRGESAEALLSQYGGGGGGGGGGVQSRADGERSAPTAERSPHELLEEAIDVLETALAMAHGGPQQHGDEAGGESTSVAAPKATAETVAHLRTGLAELAKLRGAADDQILAAVTPILQSIGAPGVAARTQDGDTGASAVQRNTLVLGAPLLGAGPPGWVVYTVLAVGSAGVIGYVMYKKNTSRKERERAVADTSTQDRQQEHRGRIQVQGGGLEMAFPWARTVPMTKAEALAGLEALKSTLSKRQLQDRAEAFPLAAKFISNTLHTCPPDISRTFQNNAIRQKGGDERVDVEIRTGTAFA